MKLKVVQAIKITYYTVIVVRTTKTPILQGPNNSWKVVHNEEGADVEVLCKAFSSSEHNIPQKIVRKHFRGLNMILFPNYFPFHERNLVSSRGQSTTFC